MAKSICQAISVGYVKGNAREVKDEARRGVVFNAIIRKGPSKVLFVHANIPLEPKAC